MPLFSERNGFTKPREVLQIESINDALRISVFNTLYSFFGEYSAGSEDEDLLKITWSNFWHKALNDFPIYYWSFYPVLKEWLSTCSWYEPYDLIEFLAGEIKKVDSKKSAYYGRYSNEHDTMLDAFRHDINEMLQREYSGYRMAGKELIPITNDLELASIEIVLDSPGKFSGSRLHMSKALELFGEKPTPDYENAVKESISAVESAVRVISGNEKHTLSQALKAIKQSREIHSALLDGWDKLYGFTSDAKGVRHAFNGDEGEIDGALAKYYLVSCSAFVNYLIEIDSNSLQ